ncbi:MAG: response regulator [Candidatus Schekmanbacteria bacterium]|nr:response regulator [Candidatus Schekmanbacteria bacterium]
MEHIRKSGISYKTTTRVCAAIAILISSMGLAGWATDSSFLKSIHADYIPIAPLTAILFIISGVILFTAAENKSRGSASGIRGALSIIVAVTGLAVIVQFFLGIDYIESIFISEPALLRGAPVGRMSPITGACFLLSGFALALRSLLPHLNKKYCYGFFTVLVTAINAIVLLGYVYGTPLLYGGTIIPVSLPTSLAFIFLGHGLMFAAGPECWPLRAFIGTTVQSRLIRFFLPVVVIIVALESITDLYFKNEGVNPALFNALDLITGVIVVSVVVSYLAKLLGGDIDRAEAERKQYEEALRESEKKYRELSQQFNTILDVIPYIITLQSSDLRIIWANRWSAAMSGKEPSELVGKHCYEMLHNSASPCKDCPVDVIFKTGEPACESVVTHFDRSFDLKAVPIKNEKGEIESVLAIGEDITDNLKLEEQLRHAQKMETVGTLTGGIAHDFNNILTAIIGYGHILLMKMKEDDPLKENVEHILFSSERAAELIQSLLTFSRKKPIDPKPVELNDIVKRITKLLLRLIGEDIELRTQLSQDRLSILAEAGQIEQIMMNLATNARDAMKGKGLLSITTGIVDIDDSYIKAHGYGKKGKYAFFSFADNGKGMDKKTRERIFEPFFTTKEVGKGTGLGMSIVYGIVKQHSGYINVYSEPESGTTFIAYLPIIETDTVKDNIKDNIIPRGKGEVVLLAEDYDEARNLIMSVLDEYNYMVIDAVDGEDAVNKFIANKDRINLVMLDVIMPKKNGKEVYSEIKKINPEIKVIFTSGYTGDIINKVDLTGGESDFVSKPIFPSELLKKVREVLDRRD